MGDWSVTGGTITNLSIWVNPRVSYLIQYLWGLQQIKVFRQPSRFNIDIWGVGVS